ncbi:D-alanyl-D-alanine carboxypeptidase [Mycobacterium sp. OAS707]|uniref:serine hydrolase domain-containing protein n=1 Tax=Mycobacterium sp. OAS707 TaxID=2663822 RepID=UPI0019E28068|nr:serine hydrolase domain-containing protein [Mycobacterium sp. OAS707]MBE1548403.1 D-alanyl-D-alanine carboxypeptidase [Mycobacterium sp. OAS707]
MKSRMIVYAAAAALLLTMSACGEKSVSQSPTPAPPSTPAITKPIDDTLAKRLDAAVDQAMTAAGVPGAIVGIWGPDGDYVRAFGVADKAARAPMKTDFYSRIGSVTKTFTVTAILQLADQGKLGLDDAIAEFIDGVPLGNRITLRQLARMQTGLVNYTATPEFQKAMFTDPRRPFTPHELIDFAFTQPNTFPPGQGFEYCNTNTVLLGMVVQKVSGQPLAAYIHDHILAPLGIMSHTSFPTTNAFPEPHAQGYTKQTADGKEAVATDWDPSWAWAAGAMISTLDDMRIWAPALATGKLLTPQMQEQRLQTVGSPGMPPQDGYGLGIFNLGGWIGHNGSLPGFQAVVVYLPQKQTSLVILTNTDIEYQGGEPSTTLATAITKVLTPDHVYSLGPQMPR